jgi:hypothetical protein
VSTPGPRTPGRRSKPPEVPAGRAGIAVITALVAQNVTDVRLSTYLTLARRTGLDEQALTELMVLLTAYLGQPYTSLAMEAVRRSFSPSDRKAS